MSAAALLAWYDRNRRELPWRRDRDPYRVWVSEIMLQQTRVETALPYYARFLERFPDVHALAAAPLDAVLALWSGLGYYRRARQLHAAAAVVAREGFPRDLEGWRRLPGIGEYTAAAVASIAAGEMVAVLDGNVERVAARLLALEEDPKRAATRRRLRERARSLLDPRRPGDGNQALMELGARLCTPRRPKCFLCPLEADCAGRRLGDPERFPAPRSRSALQRLRRVVAVVERDGRRLLFRRGDGEELLAGLWELPWTGLGGPSAEAIEPAVATESARLLGERYGGRWRLGEQLGRVRHGITHRTLELAVHRAEVDGASWVAEGPEARWATDEDVAGLATTSIVEKVLEVLRGREVEVRSRPTPDP